MDAKIKSRHSATELPWGGPVRGASSSSAWSGLRERVRSSWAAAGTRGNNTGAPAPGNGTSSASTAPSLRLRNRQRWVVKATESDRDSIKPEDWRRILAEIWEAQESGWVLQRIRERPIKSDHVVAFKVLTLMHRVLQQGPPEVAGEWGVPNGLLDELVSSWSASCESRALQGTQQLHCTQAVVEYAKLLNAKMELMVERDAGQGRFDGSMVFDRLLVESSDLLQALAVLLNFAERVMPLALHLVAPSKDWRRLERSHYMRLYLGAVLALIHEAWTLLCAVSLFVKNLLCQVHAQKQQQSSLLRGQKTASPVEAERPPWLQLSLHLLAAKPRFAWFHASMCDLVAYCHQLRCAGFAELAPCIPAVPQSLLNLFADLGELVREQPPADKDTAVRDIAADCGKTVSDISTTAGSTPSAPVEDRAAPQGFALNGNWEPSPCVLDALRTVDSLQRQTLTAGVHGSNATEDAGSVSGSSSGRVETPRNQSRSQVRPGATSPSRDAHGRGGSAPLPQSRQKKETARQPSEKQADAMTSGPPAQVQPRAQRQRNSHRSALSADPEGRGYMILDDESEPSTSVPASASISGETEQSGEARSATPPGSATVGEASEEVSPLVSISLHDSSMTWPSQDWPQDSQTPFLTHSPPSWATAICRSNIGRSSDSSGAQPLFQAPLWKVPRHTDMQEQRAAPQPAASDQQRSPQSGAGAAASEATTEVPASPSRGRKQVSRAEPPSGYPSKAIPSPAKMQRSLSPGGRGQARLSQAAERPVPARAERPSASERPRERPPPPLHPGIPLNPFDLSASQLQRAVQAMNPHAMPEAQQQLSYCPPGVSRQTSQPAPQLESHSESSPTRRYAAGPGFGGAFGPVRQAPAGPPLHVQLPGVRARAAISQPVSGQRGEKATLLSDQSQARLRDERSVTPRKLTPRNAAGGAASIDDVGAASPALSRSQRAAAAAAKPAGARPQEQPEAQRQAPKTRSPVHGPVAAAAAASGVAQSFAAPGPLAAPGPFAAPLAPAVAGAAAQPTGAGQEPPATSTRADWEVDAAELRLEEMVGSGTTAEVFRGSWHGTDVAVKKLRHSGPMSVEFTRELSVLLRLRHPNLVLFMGASMQAQPMIISEFCAGGTVFMLLHQRPAVPLSWRQKVKMSIDVAKGMNFLHRRQVVHRDLKSLNLLMVEPLGSATEVPPVKISDFGLSRMAQPEQQKVQACMTSGAGTYHWMAPEVLHGHTYDEKVDVYSYGIFLFELIARRIPYDGSGLEPVSIAVAVSKGRRPDLRCVPLDCPADLRFTMECCWAHCPTGRPGFDTILETLKLVHCQ